ncbi:MAG TPA: DUF1801 domain-containing protein [Candidatus Binatia bacterium]|nr:DUF1801 domain-containing protein [Candidatus Binatia bacterium]
MPSRASREEIPVDAFLASYPPPLVEIAERVRAIVRQALPDAIERVRPGWGLIGYDLPVGRRTVYVAFIWLETRDFHVHIGFEHGVLLDDPRDVLEGAGVTRQVRWLTFRPGDRPDEAAIAELLGEAERQALLPGAVRRAALRERSEAAGA